MKNVLSLCLLMFVLGCANKFATYVEDPKTIFEDPLTVNQQDALDKLEKQYLHKKLTYAEYVDRKKQLEEDYARKVQQRKEKIDDYQ